MIRETRMSILKYAMVCVCLIPTALFAQESSRSLSSEEQALVDLLSGCVLVGHFSTDGAPDAPPKSERYAIESVQKVKGNQWLIHSRMKVGQNELPVAVPVTFLWAGDTPMLQLTDLTIPLVGEGFSARILFYNNRYAGTWEHGKTGGTLWGRIVRQETTDPSASESQTPAESDKRAKSP